MVQCNFLCAIGLGGGGGLFRFFYFLDCPLAKNCSSFFRKSKQPPCRATQALPSVLVSMSVSIFSSFEKNVLMAHIRNGDRQKKRERGQKTKQKIGTCIMFVV